MGFFDTISKKGAEISSSFQESMDKSQRESKCKKTINENNKAIDETYSEIGKKVYNEKTINEEVMTFINEKIEDIDRRLKENGEMKKEILLLNNKKTCPQCGVEVAIETTFCPQCGAEQEKIEIEKFIPNGKRKCAGCGEIIDDKNEFCPLCGTKKEAVVAEEVTEKEEKEPAKKEKAKKEEKPAKDAIPAGKRKCSGCGEIIDDADVFCANCGTKKE